MYSLLKFAHTYQTPLTHSYCEILTSQERVASEFWVLCGNTRAGVLSPVSSLPEPHLFQEIIMLHCWLLTRSINPFQELKCHLWPRNHACGVEEGCGVMSGVSAYLVGDVAVICLLGCCRSNPPCPHSPALMDNYGSEWSQGSLKWKNMVASMSLAISSDLTFSFVCALLFHYYVLLLVGPDGAQWNSQLWTGRGFLRGKIPVVPPRNLPRDIGFFTIEHLGADRVHLY